MSKWPNAARGGDMPEKKPIKITQKQFFETLAGLKTKWEMACGVNIRTKLNKAGNQFCPAQAVARKLTGRSFSGCDFDMMAKALGMKLSFINDVAGAADSRYQPETELGQRRVKLRKKLLEATRLTEANASE